MLEYPKTYTEDDHISRIVEKRISSRQKKPVISSGEAFLALEIIAERLGYPNSSPRDVNSLTSKKTSKTKRHCSGLLLAQTYDSSNEESITEGKYETDCETETSSNSEDNEPYRCNKVKKKEREKECKTKDNGVKNNNGVKNGQLPENTHAVDLVFGGDARYKRQPIGLRQNNLALNHAIKAYQKAQSSNYKGSGDSQLHKTQLCKVQSYAILRLQMMWLRFVAK
ncbi:hypothetical protein GLOIN_2v1781373 [Rhizophagus irregularis DAOM 181602=DAOM 197198]|uniref:Uncharacterized protein n=1 Tax=Rhizophagus irregularis (strain DAOM 181602 / DAOM 197198 / MUCL 43194) TaxID=747089 RepID=A0A2P4PK04_RHIID|nr:hypothetical protein GLOIN_2v1781373 [Rhizophagus irregularis DAOM 181602=DAOM 197198]POG65721.1 hypothetical protein GLOIN_2v1781373 [Rhizophagus irregularis DAOM 181602=DAOM 197198]|eukprot:XP_025172587.1 hypothetical protein GLOIN_2v1781373 [Rhizophagus irregularis DAOM 181602=DAOM 197198]